MNATTVYGALMSKIRATASGISKVEIGSDNQSLVFTCNDGLNTKITVSLPNPVTTVAIVNKLSVDSTTNELMYDGVKICKCGFTADQLALLKKFTVGVDGSLIYDGTPLAMLTQAERDAITDITTNIKFNKSPSGDIESVEIGGAVIKETTDSNGDTAVKIGDVIVSGKETVTTSSTTTDSNGNPVNTTVTTTKTAVNTEQTTVTNSINPDNGNSVNTVEVIKGSAEGINVGSASGTKTTTETDGTGVVIDTKVEDVTYTNGIQDQWMTQEEVDNIINGFGWDM